MTEDRRQGLIRRAATAAAMAFAVLIVSSAPETADASPRMCRQIEAQLARLANNRGPSREARRYDEAINAQRAQIDKAERQLRRAGCDGRGFGFFRNQGGSACGSLEASLDRMERNLVQLQRTRSRMDRGGDGRDRARLLASYDAQGCRDIAALDRRDAVRPQRRDDGGLFGQLFGGGIERRDRYEDDRDGYDGERVRTFINPYPSGGGSYRTLCVRACDGYYWPMSYASSMGDFGRDEQNCRTMCPGTEVRLFFHRVPDQESEQMVSGDGTAYTDLPNAFKYRDADFVRPEQCGCNPNRNFSIIAGDGRGIQPLPSPQEEVPTLVPLPRPDPAADPDTLAQRDGGLTAPLLKQILRARPDAGPPDAERRIRVVGPAYLPDPAAAEDQPVPDRTVIR